MKPQWAEIIETMLILAACIITIAGWGVAVAAIIRWGFR